MRFLFGSKYEPVVELIWIVALAQFLSGLSQPINRFLGAQGNRDFFLNVVSWLADEADQVAVRPRDTRQNPIFISEAQSQAVLWLSLLVLPGAVMVCGIFVVVSRRRQK